MAIGQCQRELQLQGLHAGWRLLGRQPLQLHLRQLPLPPLGFLHHAGGCGVKLVLVNLKKQELPGAESQGTLVLTRSRATSQSWRPQTTSI